MGVVAPGGMRVCNTRTFSFSNRSVWQPGAAIGASSESGHGHVCSDVLEGSDIFPSLTLRFGVTPLNLGGRTPGTSFEPACVWGWDSPRDQKLQGGRATNVARCARKRSRPLLIGTCNPSRSAESHGT